MNRKFAVLMIALPLGVMALPKVASAAEVSSPRAAIVADRYDDNYRNYRRIETQRQEARQAEIRREEARQAEIRREEVRHDDRIWIAGHWEPGFLSIGRHWVAGHWETR